MILLDYSHDELVNYVVSLGFPKFRGEQLYDAILNGKDINDKMNLPQDVITKISSLATMQPITIAKCQESKQEKNVKFLYKLPDGNLIEGMLMKYKFGNTLCVSTQVGCKMNCAFCASGLGGWVRNLSAGEILGQVVAVNKWLGGTYRDRKITNVVLMGMGEPLDNYDNVVKFLKLATKEGFEFSARNISLSTCGIPAKIEKLAEEGLPVTLCISLHASNDTIRRSIMPIARSYSIKAVLESAKYYYTMTNRRIIIEYTVIEGVNDTFACAKELSLVLGDLPCHVNVIKLNEVPERGLKAPTSTKCQEFVNNLNRFGVSATMRRTLGDDIDGACGQLRNKTVGEVTYKTHVKKTKKAEPTANKFDDKSRKTKADNRTSKQTKFAKGKEDKFARTPKREVRGKQSKRK